MRDTAGPAIPMTLLWAALVAIGVCWGSTQVFSKLIVSEGHHPLGIAFAGALVGAPIVTAVLLARGDRLPLGRRHLIFYAICGLTGTALPNSLSYAAMHELNVGIVAIMMATVPLMTFVGSVVVGLERPRLRRLCGIGCGALAVSLLVIPRASLPEPEDSLWVGVVLLVVLSYTIENVYIALSQPADTGALQTMVGLSWAALVFLTPAVAASDSWMQITGIGRAETALLAMTVLHLIAYGGFIWLIGTAGPVFAAQVGYVVTLSGVFLGIAVRGETHSAWVWVALVLMLIGLSLVQPRR